jgi:mRNA deadenylase 3'-5' endonuclease subunit Ccr4
MASSDRTIRVLSYNVLAQCLAKSSWFPYCKGSTLKAKPRLQRLQAEIKGVDADLLALSEVDQIELWQPFLEAQGYDFIFRSKPGGRPWGSLLAFKAAVFTLEKSTVTDFNDGAVARHCGLLTVSPSPSQHEDLSPAGFARDGVGVIALLRPKHEALKAKVDCILVATSHFFWNPACPTVKIAQAAQLRLCCADLLNEQYALGGGGATKGRIATVIAGDFNAMPGDPSYRLMQSIDLEGHGSGGGGSGGGDGGLLASSMIPVWDRMAGEAIPGCDMPSLADAKAQRPPPLAAPPSGSAEMAAAASTATIPAPAHPYWLPLNPSLPPAYEAWLKRLSSAIVAALEECNGEAAPSPSSPSSSSVVELRSAYAVHRAGAGSSALLSVDELIPYEPEWTTLTPDFRGCIDYCLFSTTHSPRCRVSWTLPMPTEAEVTKDGAVAMPSERFPSDHCCLAADLTFD